VDDARRVVLDRLDERAGKVGGEGRLQALVGDHLQAALLSRTRDHSLDEVAAFRPAAA